MLPVLAVAGLTIPTGLLSLLLAYYVGSELGARGLGRLAPSGQPERWQTAFANASLLALAAGLIGARLGYAVRFSSLYWQSPPLLFSLRPGALLPLPGWLAAGAAGMLFLARKDIDFWAIADATALGVAAGLVVFNIGRFLTGAGYGLPSELPWAVELWGVGRHPVQLYEAAALVVIVALLWQCLPHAQPGETFWRFVVLDGVSVLVLDAFHATSPTWILGIRIPQVMALAVLLAGLYVLSFYTRRAETRTAVVEGSQRAQPIPTQLR